MRKDYDLIKKNFEDFISTWQTKDINPLDKLIKKEVVAYLSIVKSEQDGSQHSIFGIRDFVLDIPVTDHFDYTIGNYVCKMNEAKAQSAAEVQVVASNNDGKYFKFIATITVSWTKEDNNWLAEEIRMDVQPYSSPLMDEFAQVWHFEDNLAVLSGTVHLPCIFPEFDSPYNKITDAIDVLTEEEKVADCFYKFNYGVDWLVFRYVKETLADDFKNDDKAHFINNTKFTRQPYRYHSSAYRYKSIDVKKDKAVGVFESVVPDLVTKTVEFVKNDDKWQILSIN